MIKLLIITQKLDKSDENLGFFHSWLKEFAKHCSELTVIASFVGKTDLPENIRIYSLGKESGTRKFFRIIKFWQLLFCHYSNANAVFFHMIPEFVLAATPFIFFSKKPIALWYTHKSVTRKLKLAEKLVDYIFTASELSFRLPSKKVIFTGHAIDTNFFQPAKKKTGQGVKLLALGRISPIKGYEIIIRACSRLKNYWARSWVLSVVGGPLMPRDDEYLHSLKKLVQENDLGNRISFYGARPHTEIPEIYNDHDIFISMSSTGSLDKSVLEAMSAGLTVLVSNEAFQSILPGKYFLKKRSPEFLAERIKVLADEPRPNFILRELVVGNHSLEKTIRKIMEIFGMAV